VAGRFSCGCRNFPTTGRVEAPTVAGWRRPHGSTRAWMDDFRIVPPSPSLPAFTKRPVALATVGEDDSRRGFFEISFAAERGKRYNFRVRVQRRERTPDRLGGGSSTPRGAVDPLTTRRRPRRIGNRPSSALTRPRGRSSTLLPRSFLTRTSLVSSRGGIVPPLADRRSTKFFLPKRPHGTSPDATMGSTIDERKPRSLRAGTNRR